MLAPTLIVGLGGTGSKIVSRVFKLASEEEKSRIGFVVFDTDINELRDIKNEFPSMQTVQTSTKLTVGEYLNIDTHARDNWFPVHRILNAKSLTEGAGQVRAVSRLALETAIRAGKMEPLHKAIEDLYKLDGTAQSQALRVIIVSSLAGGTGSGILLPVALYIRHFLAEKFQQSASIVRGFFILPEVFFEVIRGNSERNNLKCNAYATIRELDAFLMKGDDSLPEKYRNKLKMEFPRPGTSLYDEYDVMPYDFCFLFDAQNVNGEKLNNFDQYLQHAANCIYSQSISPINKRSNSSEDNVIRELCRAGGRNRFCGAGTSIIKYPYEDVVNYLSLRWTNKCISKQWMQYDRKIKELLRKDNAMRMRGMAVPGRDRGNEYVLDIESKAGTGDTFSKYLCDQCFDFDENGIAIPNTEGWNKYIKALKEYAKKYKMADIDKLYGEAIDAKSEYSDNPRKAKWEDIQACYDAVKNYITIGERRIKSYSESIAYSLFENEDASFVDKEAFRLETYLFNSSGSFIHPNATRYFLYKLESILQKNKDKNQQQLKDAKTFIDNFEESSFGGSADQLGDKGHTPNKVNVYADIGDLIEKTKEYLNYQLLDSIFGGALNYVKSLNNAYESLYNTFEFGIDSVSKKSLDILNRFKNRKGDTTRFVCASSKCLESFEKKCSFSGNGMNLPSDLCIDIFRKIRKYALANEKPEGSSFFSGVFDNELVGFFRKSVVDQYEEQLNIDVISALELEAEFEQQKYSEKEKTYYAKTVIAQTKKLSSPFIEAPLGEERPPLDSCAYNPGLDNKEDPARHELVSSELKDFGGVPDADIDKNMIMFYRAIYGLRANDLSKFAPPKEAETVRPNAGEYFKAYFDLISQIKPKSQNTPVITPHIDRKWHIIENMPDLDEDHQKMIEDHIYTAFVSGLVMKKIKYTGVSKAKTWYIPSLMNESEDVSDDFVVSNNTPCDKFYEVLDAITINPIITGMILRSVELDYEAESLQNAKPTFDESAFGKNLKTMEFQEYPIDGIGEDEPKSSIIDIALLLAMSTPSEEFDMHKGIAILKTSFRILEEYVKKITSKDLYLEEYGNIIWKQYEIFLRDLRYYESQNKYGLDNYGLYITKIFDCVEKELYRAEEFEKAEAVRKENDGRNQRKMHE